MTRSASFNLGNALAAQQRWEEAVAAYERGAGRRRARRLAQPRAGCSRTSATSPARCAPTAARPRRASLRRLCLAFRCASRGARGAGRRRELAAHGRPERRRRRRLLALVRTLDPALEAELRAGADHFPSARSDLGHLLLDTGRTDEARFVLSAAPSSASRGLAAAGQPDR